jgi:hypothetical protein
MLQLAFRVDGTENEDGYLAISESYPAAPCLCFKTFLESEVIDLETVLKSNRLALAADIVEKFGLHHSSRRLDD